MNNETRNNPYAPPAASVGDVALKTESEPAGRGVRLGAYLLDALIAILLIYGPFMLLGGGTAIIEAMRNPSQDPSAALAPYMGVAGMGAVVGFLVWLVLTLKFVLANRQTIGKKILGIKVVRSDSSQVGIGRLFWLRNFVPGLIAAVPFVGFVFVLVDALMIFGESRQCLHDRIADTIVIRA